MFFLKCVCNVYDTHCGVNILCITQSAPVTGGGQRSLGVPWGVLVSVTQGQDSVPAGRGWWASSVTSVRTDTGTWTEPLGVSPAAVIPLTLSPTSVTRQEPPSTIVYPTFVGPYECY